MSRVEETRFDLRSYRLKEKAASAPSAVSEAVRARRTLRGGLMPGLMEYVSPISPASRV